MVGLRFTPTCVGKTTKSGYAPRRWSFAEVEKAKADAAATATEFEARLLAEMTQEIQRNRRIARRARRG
jgi:hypothetical protein